MSNVTTGQEQRRESAIHKAPYQALPEKVRSLLATGVTLLAICATLFLAWQTVGANGLIGGSRRSIMLQPLSIERAIGLSLASAI